MKEHPTSEQLAALIDHGLPGTERTEVLHHLTSCRRCFEEYVESSQLAESASAPVQRTPRDVWWRFAAAAALLVGALLTVWSPWRSTRPDFDQAVDALAGKITRTDIAPTPSGVLGFAPLGSSARAAAFRRGTLSLRHELALREGWREQANSLQKDIEALPATQQTREETTAYQLGWWCEAVRVAGRAGLPPHSVVDVDREWPGEFIDSVGPSLREDLDRLRRAADAGDLAAVEREIEGIVVQLCM